MIRLCVPSLSDGCMAGDLHKRGILVLLMNQLAVVENLSLVVGQCIGDDC